MLPRFDASLDWSAPDAVALLDELAAVQSSPISMALEREGTNVIRTGMPLPKELSAAPWGDALPNGLRLAYLLQPRAAEYPLNTPLKGRILIHNAGKQPIVFRAWTWFQASHKAPFNIVSLEWLTLGRLVPFRLAPGEFAEVRTTGVGVGPKNGADDWQDARVGSWVEVKAGDEVTLTTDPIPLADANERTDGEPRWWLDHIKARLTRHLPFPDDAEARKLLLYRVAMELFGTPVSDEINAAFVADRGAAALDALAKRLYDRPGQHAWVGSLTSAPSKFRVLPADPDAAKRPRVAKNPGSYRLGDLVRLDVSRHADEFRIMNDASIEFYSADPNKPMPREPYKIELADGYSTWAAAWMKDATTIWIAQKGLVRSIDFAKLEMVRETQYEGDKIASAPIPADIREALRTVLAGPDSGQEQRPIAPPAASAPPKGRF
jgi:hypothetical protein